MTEMKGKRDSVRRERRTERELKGREDRERESEKGRETEKRDMFQQTVKHFSESALAEPKAAETKNKNQEK
jgi:hypothetical protein